MLGAPRPHPPGGGRHWQVTPATAPDRVCLPFPRRDGDWFRATLAPRRGPRVERRHAPGSATQTTCPSRCRWPRTTRGFHERGSRHAPSRRARMPPLPFATELWPARSCDGVARTDEDYVRRVSWPVPARRADARRSPGNRRPPPPPAHRRAAAPEPELGLVAVAPRRSHPGSRQADHQPRAHTLEPEWARPRQEAPAARRAIPGPHHTFPGRTTTS